MTSISQINAVATDSDLVKNALAKPEFRSAARLLASIGMERPTGPISVHELDAKLSGSRLSIEQRLQCKLALGRVGLLT